MPVVSAADVDITYRVAGSGTETLVLVNGVGDDLEAWAPQLGDFLDAGLRVVTFDNRGVGGSSQPSGPYTSGEMADDAKSVVDAVGGGPVHLVGVSMGGVIAQEYALAYPEDLRSVVLANTYAVADAFTAAAFNSWAMVAESAGMEVMMRQMAPWIFSPQLYEREPERVAELVEAAEATTQPPASFVAQIAALVDHDCSDRLADIRVPALVIAASSDILIRPTLSHQLFEGLPEASWSLVPGGHAAFWENPQPWNRAVIDFVRAHSASGT